MKKVCSNCGSSAIRVDAIAVWNPIKQGYDLDSVDENIAFCHNCDGDNKAIDYVPKIMMAREETWIVTTAMSEENSFCITRVEDKVELSITVGIKEDANGEWFGYFELDGGEHWYAEGNIDIEDDEVTGYDGTFELSPYIVNKLKEWGYDCSEVE